MIQEKSKLPSKAEEDKMWEQRRYEIAKAVLPIVIEICIERQPTTTVADRVEFALIYADELIKQLKETKQ